MSDDSIEMMGPNGIEVLTGDAAKAYSLLQVIVLAKRSIEMEARLTSPPERREECEASALTERVRVSALSLAEPHKGQVIEAVESLIRMQEQPGRPAAWTAGERRVLDQM